MKALLLSFAALCATLAFTDAVSRRPISGFTIAATYAGMLAVLADIVLVGVFLFKALFA